MKKYCILAILCCFSYLAAAQTPVEKGLESINRASAEAYIGFLAHDELQGREAGYHGSKVAAQYVASLLQPTGENGRKKDGWKYTPIRLLYSAKKFIRNSQ